MSKKEKEVGTAEETTDLATTPEAGTPMVYDGSADEFLTQADQEDSSELSSFPRLVIEQKGKKAALGSLYCAETEEEFETMKMVLLKESKSRIMWPEKYDKDNDPVCRSFDGIVPNMDDFKDVPPMADNCEDCPYGSWITKDGKNIPPDCKEVKDLLILDHATYIPYWISFSATTLSPINKSLTGKPLKIRKMSLTAKRAKAGKSPAHSCMFSFDMSTVLVEFDSGDSQIPVVTNLTELPDDDMDVMVNIAMQVHGAKAHHAKDIVEDEEGQAGDKEQPDKF